MSDLPKLSPLGIVGVGQIARMTQQAALKLGIQPRLLVEGLEDSAAQAAADRVVAHPDAVAGLVEECGVVTVEHERVDIGLLQALEDAGHCIRPGLKTIRAAFDKIHQRRILLNRSLPVPVFAELNSADDLIDFATVFGWPVVIKSVRAGAAADRNVWIVESRAEGLRVMSEQAGRPLMAENFQPIVTELVVILARRPGGSIRVYPVVESIQRDGQRHVMRSPASVGREVANEARAMASAIAEHLEAVGVLAVEFFLTSDGLIVNEIAARPHNAGHMFIEGSPTSQFENHVRAVLDLPLGPTWATHSAIVTRNVIGGIDRVDPARNLADALAVEGVSIHLYGKMPAPGSKLGHVTAVGDDLEQVDEMAMRAEAALLGRRPNW